MAYTALADPDSEEAGKKGKEIQDQDPLAFPLEALEGRTATPVPTIPAVPALADLRHHFLAVM